MQFASSNPQLLICEAVEQTNSPLLYYIKMLRFPASKLLIRNLNLLKGAFLYSTGGAGSVYSNPTNQLKRFGDGDRRNWNSGKSFFRVIDT